MNFLLAVGRGMVIAGFAACSAFSCFMMGLAIRDGVRWLKRFWRRKRPEQPPQQKVDLGDIQDPDKWYLWAAEGGLGMANQQDAYWYGLGGINVNDNLATSDLNYNVVMDVYKQMHAAYAGGTYPGVYAPPADPNKRHCFQCGMDFALPDDKVQWEHHRCIKAASSDAPPA